MMGHDEQVRFVKQWRKDNHAFLSKESLRNWRDWVIMSEFCTPIERRLCRQCVCDEQVIFVKQWKKDNDAFLSEQLGLSDCTHQKTFVKGVLLATSSSSHTVPLLQDVIQADGAHSQYGKYTLYSTYGTNANGHMSPVAFGLIFGNEEKTNWATFWNFVKEIHPSLDNPCKTFLTNQDKGCLASLQDAFEHVAQFMCSFHRHQNIVKNCGGSKGKIPYSA